MYKKAYIWYTCLFIPSAQIIGAGADDSWYGDGPDRDYHYYVAARKTTDLIVALAEQQNLKENRDFIIPRDPRIKIGYKKTSQGMDLWFSSKASLVPLTIAMPIGEYQILDKPPRLGWHHMDRYRDQWKSVAQALKSKLNGTLVTYTGLLTVLRQESDRMYTCDTLTIHMELGCDTAGRPLPRTINFDDELESKKISAALEARYVQEG